MSSVVIGHHWSSSAVIGSHWQSSVFRRTGSGPQPGGNPPPPAGIWPSLGGMGNFQNNLNRKFIGGGGDFGGPLTEGGSHTKKVGDHWSIVSRLA